MSGRRCSGPIPGHRSRSKVTDVLWITTTLTGQRILIAVPILSTFSTVKRAVNAVFGTTIDPLSFYLAYLLALYEIGRMIGFFMRLNG